MIPRIALSCLLALVLLGAVTVRALAAPLPPDAGQVDADVAGAVAPDADVDNGIGTSPSVAGFLADHGAGWLQTALAALASIFAWAFARAGLSGRWKDLLEELGRHARDVVQEVFQVYVEAIKAARADGKLTELEAGQAKAMAIARLKQRLSWAKLLQLGGGLLARIFGGGEWQERVEGWLGGAVETAVAEAKREGKAAGLVSSGKDAPDAVVAKLPLEPPPLPR